MKRNMHRRIEIACPIISGSVRDKIRRIMFTNASDNVKARIMNPDGTYMKVQKPENIGDVINSQEIFLYY